MYIYAPIELYICSYHHIDAYIYSYGYTRTSIIGEVLVVGNTSLLPYITTDTHLVSILLRKTPTTLHHYKYSPSTYITAYITNTHLLPI